MLTLEIEILYQKWMPKKETINLLYSYAYKVSIRVMEDINTIPDEELQFLINFFYILE